MSALVIDPSPPRDSSSDADNKRAHVSVTRPLLELLGTGAERRNPGEKAPPAMPADLEPEWDAAIGAATD